MKNLSGLNILIQYNPELNRSSRSDHSYHKSSEEFDVHCKFDDGLNVEASALSPLTWEDGKRVVELKHPAVQLYCKKYSHPFHLSIYQT